MLTSAFETSAQTALANASYPSLAGIDLAFLPSVKVYFRDVNADLGIDGDKDTVDDALAIRKKIRNVLSTPIGSEPFEPEYGSLLPFRLFEPISAVNSWNIENDTITAVSRWLGSEISMQRSQCYVQELLDDYAPSNEGYYIRMVYTIIRTRVVTEYNFSVYR